MTATNDATKVYPGIWCPTAEFLCLICHGPNYKFGRSEGQPMRNWTDQPFELAPPRHCKCDGCDRQIAQVDERDRDELSQPTELGYIRDRINHDLLAANHRLNVLDEMTDCRRARLDQTGGMCCNLYLYLSHLPDDTRYLMVTCHDDAGDYSVLDVSLCVSSDEKYDDGTEEWTTLVDGVPLETAVAKVVEVTMAEPHRNADDEVRS